MTTKFPLLHELEGLQLSWADLMFLESEAMLGAMLSLVDQGVPALPVHDSLIVPAPYEVVASLVLKRAYQDVVGVEPVLEVSRG
jgi:hypothetical protein